MFLWAISAATADYIAGVHTNVKRKYI